MLNQFVGRAGAEAAVRQIDILSAPLPTGSIHANWDRTSARIVRGMGRGADEGIKSRCQIILSNLRKLSADPGNEALHQQAKQKYFSKTREARSEWNEPIKLGRNAFLK
jgi:hypothetical protein